MKKADIDVRMTYAQSVHKDARIEYDIDGMMLFVYFPGGILSSKCCHVSEILVDINEVRVVLNSKVCFVWRATGNSIWCIRYS